MGEIECIIGKHVGGFLGRRRVFQMREHEREGSDCEEELEKGRFCREKMKVRELEGM